MAKQFGDFLGKFLEYDINSGDGFEKIYVYSYSLGHGESYCPIRLRIEPDKTVFSWDRSLRAATWRNMVASRWLRQGDSSQWSNESLEGNNQKTKLNAKKMKTVRLKCGFENGIDIVSSGSRGGIFLGWKGNSLIQLKSFSSSHINVKVHDDEIDAVWHLTGFYGNPVEWNRRESWDLLR
ncbi:hypothetical protein CXB51_013810 [Gossypium anomalum]|uniref:Uncharacterized protein n=1 Tax=Gossypium anomalum TaxID=47600 RepID=A0A8J6CX46_9ROSI|nr:hypothetical protein CXB51_013810 [Gossypium anomalum]